MEDKVLFISNYRNNGGWSDSAVAHMRCIKGAGIKIAPVHINLGQGMRSIPDIDHISTNIKNCNICVQHLLPNFGFADRRFQKNIIYYFVETTSIPQEWVEIINTFDLAVVATNAAYEASRNSGVKIDIEILPIPIDYSEFSYKTNSNLDIKDKFNNKCLFYTIVDNNPRKNLETTLKSFYLEFHPSENVELIVKISGDGNKSTEYVKNIDKSVKQGLRIYPEVAYKSPIIIGDMPRNDLIELHKQCDVYISTSRGEGFSIPSIEAAILGKICVVPHHSSFADFFDINKYGFSSFLSPCFGAHAPEGLHTAREEWWESYIESVQLAMRMAYTDHQNNNINELSTTKISSHIKKYTHYDVVGKSWQKLLTI